MCSCYSVLGRYVCYVMTLITLRAKIYSNLYFYQFYHRFWDHTIAVSFETASTAEIGAFLRIYLIGGFQQRKSQPILGQDYPKKQNYGLK